MGFETVISPAKLEKNIFHCFTHFLMKGSIEIGIDEKIVAELPKIDESLNFESLLTMQVEKLTELKALLMSHIGSLVLKKMIDEAENLSFDREFIKEILGLFFKYAFESENGNISFLINF